MAPSMYASGLPTIKCSDCGADLEISMMGDHVCAALLGAQDAQIHETNHDRIAPSPLLTTSAFERPLSRTLEPQQFITDVYEARLRERPSPPAPTLNRSTTFDAATTVAMNSSLRPMSSASRPQSPVRSMTDPPTMTAQTPMSEVKLAQDSAFPVFPSKRKGAPTYLALQAGKIASDGLPLSPMSPSFSGAHVLKRMNTMTRGPFGSRIHRENPRMQAQPGRREKDKDTGDDRAAAGPLPPSRPPRPESDESLSQTLHNASMDVPTLQPISDRPGFTISPPPSFDNAPEIVAERVLQPIRAPNDPPPEFKNDQALKEEEIKPLPDLTTLHSRAQRQPSHASVSSESSLSSRSGFGSRTESSRSSHSSPFSLMGPSEFPPKNMSVDQESIHSIQSRDSITRHKPSDSDSREAAFGEPSPLALNTASSSPVVSRMPVPTSGPLHTVVSPSPGPQPNPFSPSLRAASLPQAPQETSQELRPEPTPRSKGDCRGCSKPIFGKSVKAADGRLTGRYHRECFVCHTCKTSFDTVEFYVLNNNPYCAHHYHVLNHSLCYSCNQGIEGKYLETAPRRRHHLDCFACSDCGRPLTSDYYEIGQRFYCEADAFRVYEKSRLLSPGKRFPERRTTRLMQM